MKRQQERAVIPSGRISDRSRSAGYGSAGEGELCPCVRVSDRQQPSRQTAILRPSAQSISRQAAVVPVGTRQWRRYGLEASSRWRTSAGYHSQMTLGGDPNNAAISAKSESRDTSVKPLVLAYSHTTRSLALANSTSRTWLESGNKSANERQSLTDVLVEEQLHFAAVTRRRSRSAA